MKWLIEKHKKIFVLLFLGVLIVTFGGLAYGSWLQNAKEINELVVGYLSIVTTLIGVMVSKSIPEFHDGKPD